jgi:hypothetical protein
MPLSFHPAVVMACKFKGTTFIWDLFGETEYREQGIK